MKHKVGDWVLVDNGNGLYSVHLIVGQSADNKEFDIRIGNYSTKYESKRLHKCPISLKPRIVKR